MDDNKLFILFFVLLTHYMQDSGVTDINSDLGCKLIVY